MRSQVVLSAGLRSNHALQLGVQAAHLGEPLLVLGVLLSALGSATLREAMQHELC